MHGGVLLRMQFLLDFRGVVGLNLLKSESRTSPSSGLLSLQSASTMRKPFFSGEV